MYCCSYSKDVYCTVKVVIALTGGELVYFEMDTSGQLNEYTERKEMSADVVCMALGTVSNFIMCIDIIGFFELAFDTWLNRWAGLTA